MADDERARPQAPVASTTPRVTRDPSMSRAVDVEAAGGDPAALGYDRTEEEISGAPHEPIAPSEAEQPQAAEGEPAGQWGSSGSTP